MGMEQIRKGMVQSMKRKTYNNVMKAIKMIQSKGYDFKEASQIALNIFDEHENGEMPIEFYIEKIANKEEWIKGSKVM